MNVVIPSSDCTDLDAIVLFAHKNPDGTPFRQHRQEVAGKLENLLSASKVSFPGLFPFGSVSEGLTGPINTIKKFVPDPEALGLELDRFATVLNNLQNEGAPLNTPLN